MQYYHFIWPTTNIVPTPQEKKQLTLSATPEEKVQLNEQSKLKQLGYHYTKSETERWIILRKAVNIYGLKSIAYTGYYYNSLKRPCSGLSSHSYMGSRPQPLKKYLLSK